MRIATVIPTWNRAERIGRAIASAQSQTTPTDEIIVVDDASDDDTRDIVSDLARSDGRLRLITLGERAGACNARNVGVSSTEAEWVAFLDSDDAWHPSKLEAQVASLEGVDAVACFTGLTRGDPPIVSLPPERVSLALLRASNVLGSTSTALVRRKAFLSAGGFDILLPSCQDWDLWLRLAEQGSLLVCRSPLVTYDTTDGNRISLNREKVLLGHSMIFERILSGVSEDGERRHISAMHQRRLAEIHEWDLGLPTDAMRHAAHWLVLEPSIPALKTVARTAVRSIVHALSR